MMTTMLKFILSKCPWLTAWWVKPLVYLIIAASIFFAGWHAHSITDKAAQSRALQSALVAQRKAYDLQRTKDEAEITKYETLIKGYADKSSVLQASNERLSYALEHATLISQKSTRVKDENGTEHDCPTTVRNDTYRLCYNAAISGTSEAIAACEASGMSKAMHN